MVRIKQRRELIVETERSYSVRIERGTPVQLFCRICGELSEMLSINEAANLTVLGWREILNRTETGDLHFIETETGEIYICAASLSAMDQKNS